jgi:hypothetical protein
MIVGMIWRLLFLAVNRNNRWQDRKQLFLVVPSFATQLVRFTEQLLEVIAFGDVGHLASAPLLVDFDAQLLHLLLQLLLAGIHLACHLLKDLGKLSQFIRTPGGFIEALMLKGIGLDRCGGGCDTAYLL